MLLATQAGMRWILKEGLICMSLEAKDVNTFPVSIGYLYFLFLEVPSDHLIICWLDDLFWGFNLYSSWYILDINTLS